MTGTETNLPRPSLFGDHQVLTAAGVVSTLRMLAPDFIVSRANIIEGRASARLRGRIEVYPTHPKIVVDVCHNESAAHELLLFLMENRIAGRHYAIFSMLEDKPIKRVVSMFRQVVDSWHITELESARSMSIEHLKKILNAHTSNPVSCCSSPGQALQQVRNLAEPDDRIIVFGSTYLAGAIISIMDRERCNA